VTIPRNPYAPPGAPGAPAAPVMPLPEGVRRVRLDPVRYRAFVRARLVRSYVLLGVAVVAVVYVMRDAFSGGTFAVWLGIVAAGIALGVVRVRRLNARAFETYELLVGPRAIRRVVAGVPPAEVLRPEVTGAFETRWGVWLTCTTPRCALYVARAVDGYDELRAALAAWAPIEVLGGGRAWWRSRRASVRQAPRDPVHGTALAADPTLGPELELLRHASSTAWMAFPQVSPLRRRRIVLAIMAMWILIFAVFELAYRPGPP